jgi:hypothetical protein
MQDLLTVVFHPRCRPCDRNHRLDVMMGQMLNTRTRMFEPIRAMVAQHNVEFQDPHA